MKEFSFDTVFSGDDLTRSTKMYGTTIRVCVPIISLMCINMISNDSITKRNLRRLWSKDLPLFETVSLIFPERWLSPPERRSLFTKLTEHQSVKDGTVKLIDIITQDDHILFDCDPEIVRILLFTKKGTFKKAEELWSSPFAANREEIYRMVFGRD